MLIFLGEYDTPLQEAYVRGIWDRMSEFVRKMFNVTFRTNPYLERSLMTGITRVSKESIFSDLNNLTVVTTTSEQYRTPFGFTEDEVFGALEDQGMPECKEEVKKYINLIGPIPVRTVWSLLLASGYLKVSERCFSKETGRFTYCLKLTNLEIRMMFEDMIRGWFGADDVPYNRFLRALLLNDVDYMNEYMNEMSQQVFSSFDSGKRPGA